MIPEEKKCFNILMRVPFERSSRTVIIDNWDLFLSLFHWIKHI